MELSTPNKNQISPSPLSHFENSPVFNYINSLSPLELVKSIHSSDNAFNSLSLSSSLPVFASPLLGSGRETGGPSLNRCQLVELSNPGLAKSIEDDNPLGGESLEEVVNLSACGSLEKEDDIDTHIKRFELAVVIPKALEIGSEGTDGDMVKLPLDGTETRWVTGESNDRRYLCETERGLRRIGWIERNENEERCDWGELVSNVSDALNFKSSIIDGPSEDPKMVDPGMISFISDVLQIPHDTTSTLGDVKSNCHAWSSGEGEMARLEIQQSEFEEEKEGDQTFNNLSDTLFNGMIVNDTTTKVDVKGKRSSSKQRVRRRCLVFEMAGAHKMKSTSDTKCTSILSQSDVEDAQIEENHPTPTQTARVDVRSTLSVKGIGLHLNALATTSSDGEVVKVDNLASELVPCDSKDQLMENGAVTSMDINVHEGLAFSSPKMKRHKLEHVGVACKRCNCKRSKCLKLYCECFAAGLYCIEPCSCQECLNTPAHEDTVVETRRLIESRNPLAFAPKVIRSGDSVTELGDETNKTPASARHKRGCNCKKSSCLKKYCECFQEGVGCSSNCRCEGCKNTFGSKIVERNELEAEYTNAPEKNASETATHSKEEHPDLPMPPATPRSPIQLPITLKGQISGSSLPVIPFQIYTGPEVGKTDFYTRQPKFETHLQVIPEDECPEIQTSNLSPPNTGVVSASPNCKRVSPPHPGFKSSLTWRSRKLILRSVPTFPSLNLPTEP